MPILRIDVIRCGSYCCVFHTEKTPEDFTGLIYIPARILFVFGLNKQSLITGQL
jgi:hypothetical protein